METTEKKTLTLEEKYGIHEKKTLRKYVLWLRTKDGEAFILKHGGAGLREMGNHWTCMEFQANIIYAYALEVVAE